MDPLALYSGVYNIAEAATKVVRTLSSIDRKYHVEDIRRESTLHAHSMGEIKDMILLMETEMPSSARSCLQICDETFRKLNAMLSQLVKNPRTTLLSKDVAIANLIDKCGRTVAMLRNIVTSEILKQLFIRQHMAGRTIEINSQRANPLQDEDLHKIITIVQELSQNSDTQQVTINLRDKADSTSIQDSAPSGGQTSVPDEHVSLVPEETDEHRLFAVREAFSRGLRSVTHRNPFIYHACVMSAANADQPQTVTLKVDTGSKQNWVSLASLQSWGLLDQAVELDPELHQYKWQGFFGEPPRQPTMAVELSWYMVSIGKTRKTRFLVNESSDTFDLMIGWEFLVHEGPAAIWNEPVGAIREIRLTSDQFQQAQVIAARSEAASENLDMLRRSHAAAKRERQRHAAAASKAATKAHSQATTIAGTGAQTPVASRSVFSLAELADRQADLETTADSSASTASTDAPRSERAQTEQKSPE